MAQKYAKGSRAWGICGRSGQKMLLKDMVFDGYFPNMRVHPDWWESKHPQEFMPKVEDPTALYRPSPEVIAPPSSSVLTASIQGNDVSVTWSPADSGITEIASYSLFRGTDGAAPTLLITCNVLRDFLGGITGVQHCTTTPSIPADDTSSQPQPGDSQGSVFDKVTVEDAPVTYVDAAVSIGHTYCYYVVANPMGNNQSVAQGPPSAPSNTDCLFLPGQATAPVLAGSIVGAGEVDLTWTAATVPGSTIASYALWRNVDGGAFTLLTSVAGNLLTYNDLTVTHGHVYQYYVIAHPVAGLDSAQSNTVTEGAQATTPVLAGSQVASDVDLSWSASTVAGSTIANYALLRNVDGGAFSPLTTVAGNALAYTDLAPAAGHTYGYTVQALATFGLDSAQSNEIDVAVSGGGVTLDQIIDLAFVDSTHVVGVTASGNAAWSADGGVTTNPVILPLANINQFHLVIAGSGVAVAIGEDPDLGRRLVTSSDAGHTWVDTTPMAMGSPLGVYFSVLAGNLFISTDNSNPAHVFSSPDGVTWTQNIIGGIAPQITQFPGDRTIETGGFIYVGGEGVYRSTDGLDFTQVKTPVLGGSYDSGPVQAGSLFGVSLAAGFFPFTEQIFTSPDGTAWTSRSFASSPFTTAPYLALDAFNGVFVTGVNGGDSQTFASSPDAITWTDHNPGIAGFSASGPVFLSTATNLYLFGQGIIHTPDFSGFTLDVAVTNSVSNMKAFGIHVCGCGADIGGTGLFFKVA